MRIAVLACLLAAVAVVVACTSGQPPAPEPTPGPPLTTAGLKVRLIEELGPLWFCDPDLYPVAHEDEAALAQQRFPEVQADAEAFAAITALLGIEGDTPNDEEKLAIYRAWKQLNAIALEPAGDGSRFDYLNMPPPGSGEGRRTTGTIDDRGALAIDQQAPAGEPMCPICLALGTRIAAPDGDVAIEDVRAGMRVWSVDDDGRRIVATVTVVGRTPVPATHHVVRLVLDDGRVVRASPRHPLADGRLVGGLQPGDPVDGAKVIGATLEPYEGGFTFDLLADGPTGTYLADGVPLRSTLQPPTRQGVIPR